MSLRCQKCDNKPAEAKLPPIILGFPNLCRDVCLMCREQLVNEFVATDQLRLQGILDKKRPLPGSISLDLRTQEGRDQAQSDLKSSDNKPADNGSK